MLRTVIRLGLLRGVFRGSKLWLYLGATAFSCVSSAG